MVKALVDSNILIDYLRDIPEALSELALYRDPAICSVSWIEVMVGVTPALESITRNFLDRFVVVPLDEAVAERAVQLRRTHRLKLADAIAWASAQVTGRIFVTRDAKDFARIDPSIRIPYTL